MVMDTSATSSTNPEAVDATHEGVNAPDLQVFVFALFFIFGGITSLNDVIIPKLKELFTLDYFQASLVQVCFSSPMRWSAFPARGWSSGSAICAARWSDCCTMIVGCLLFIPASQTATFGVFLLAYFVLATGVVLVQIVANPLISLLGPPRTASSRLTFAQAFNSFGTTIFPYFGAILILGGLAARRGDRICRARRSMLIARRESQAIVHGYLGIAAALAVVAAVVWLFRNRLKGEQHESSSLAQGLALLKRTRFGFGALCIFLYVGAEVAIGSFLVSYLIQSNVLGLVAGGRRVS